MPAAARQNTMMLIEEERDLLEREKLPGHHAR
jgi:hypothetical protein